MILRPHLHALAALLTILLLPSTTSASFLSNYFAQFAFDDLPPILPSPTHQTSLPASLSQQTRTNIPGRPLIHLPSPPPPPSPTTPATANEPPHQSRPLIPGRPILLPFLPAAPTCAVPTHHLPSFLTDLRKRQSSACASGYSSCALVAGNQGLCCPTTAICSADAMGSVGCCPHGAACTGTVGSPSSTPASSATATAAAVTSTAPGGGALVGAAGATDNEQTTSTSMMTGPAVLTGSGGEVTATVSQSGFVSGETVFAALAPEKGRGRGVGAVVGVAVGGVVWAL